MKRKWITLLLSFALLFSVTGIVACVKDNSTQEPPTIEIPEYPAENLEFSLLEDESGYEVSGIGTCTDKNILIPSTYNNLPVTSIKYKAFSGHTSLTSIIIPDGVTSIGAYAFSGCTRLISITIPDSVTSIKGFAFYQCSNLTSIEIPASVTSIEACTFDTCNNLKSVTFKDNSQLTSIDSMAFFCCRSLTSITLPASVTSIDFSRGGAFNHCDSLTNINMDENNQNYKSIDGNLYTKDEKTLLQYAIGKTTTSFSIPTGVTTIGIGAFLDCKKLTNIIIPESISSIGYDAFSGCSKLTSIIIPENVTSIEPWAFEGCQKLIEVVNKSSLPITIESEEYGCVAKYAKQIITEESESNIIKQNDYIFYNDNGTYYLLGYEGIETNLTLPNSINGNNYKVYQYAFTDCNNLTGITIPEKVTSIEDYAFANCTNLTSINFNNSQLTSIGNYAFTNCNSLTSITIPEKVTSIGDYTFASCINLTNVLYEENSQLTSIGKYAFSRCYKLKNFTIPNEVTSIGNGAFSLCMKLTSIIIPEKVTSIEYGAFSYCNKLIEVVNKSSLPIAVGAGEYGNVAQYAKQVITNENESNIIKQNDYVFFNDNGTYYLLDYEGIETNLTLPSSINGNNYSIYQYAFTYCDDLMSIIIPDGVTSIGMGAFSNCNKLTSISISASVTSIDNINDVTFCSGCNSLINITVDKNNQNYKSIDGNLYTKDGKTLIKYAIGKTETSFSIPTGVTSIGTMAFIDCNSSTSIIIPNSVTSIESLAFYNCYNLTSINIPKSVTSIESFAFYNCNLIIYCEVAEQPNGWNENWNNFGGHVIWDYKNQASE